MIDSLRHLDGCFIARLPGNTRVRLQPGTAAALFQGRECQPILEPEFLTPADARCYAVRTQPQAYRFGFAKLGTYALPDCPGRLFELGISGEMQLSLAHMHGLRSLVTPSAPERMTLRQLCTLPALDMQLREAICSAITDLCGGVWDYPLLKRNPGALTDACRPALFRTFFAHGLLMQPGRFLIRDLSTPIIDA